MEVYASTGGRANETLSKRQAEEILRKINNANQNCANAIAKEVKNFSVEVSFIWEDKNAVEYMKKLKSTIEKIIESLSSNNTKLCDAVTSIANFYFSIGGMDTRISLKPQKIRADIDVSAVNEYFKNGYNRDEFGFKNIESGPIEVMNAFENLKNELEKTMSQTVSEMQRINAFGNYEVKNNIVKSAGKIIEIVKEQIYYLKTETKEDVQEVADYYRKIGESATQSATMRIKSE